MSSFLSEKWLRIYRKTVLYLQNYYFLTVRSNPLHFVYHVLTDQRHRFYACGGFALFPPL